VKLRSITQDEELALKAAVKRALKMGGGAASVQHMVGAEETRLSRYANPHVPDAQAKISDAIEIDRQAGAPVILSAMASLMGYRLVAEEGASDAKLSSRDIARVATETSQFMAVLADATDDDVVDADERRLIDQEAEEAVASIRRAQAKAKGAS
jgi:hypothetical protein